ncbi:unnamed protein product [Timema podura]|uniref:Uncharacterized protein n=1 Tax=Timema podura TaxID=61482 RepID=A0ABN7NTB3_TIMPD|nr:unnamed protein product [Timema podura]
MELYNPNVESPPPANKSGVNFGDSKSGVNFGNSNSKSRVKFGNSNSKSRVALGERAESQLTSSRLDGNCCYFHRSGVDIKATGSSGGEDSTMDSNHNYHQHHAAHHQNQHQQQQQQQIYQHYTHHSALDLVAHQSMYKTDPHVTAAHAQHQAAINAAHAHQQAMAYGGGLVEAPQSQLEYGDGEGQVHIKTEDDFSVILADVRKTCYSS